MILCKNVTYCVTMLEYLFLFIMISEKSKPHKKTAVSKGKSSVPPTPTGAKHEKTERQNGAPGMLINKKLLTKWHISLESFS